MFKLQLRLVAGNTYRNRIKSFSFWALVIGPLMIPIIGILVTFLSGATSTPKLAVVNQPQIVQALKSDKAVSADISEISTVTEAKSQLTRQKIDGYLTESQGKYTLTTTSKSNKQLSDNQSVIMSALTNYQIGIKSRELHLTGAQVVNLLTPAKLSAVTLDMSGKAQNEKSTGANTAFAMFSVVFIFLFLTLYVGVISQEIANEKSNRIMEILLAATNATVQYYGKILGVLMLALTQFGIYIVGGTALYLVFKDNSAVKAVMDMVQGIDIGFLVYVVVMALVAIFSYLILASIMASMVNEQSQAQQATMPVTYLALIGYIAGIALNLNPGNLFLQVLSFVPFVSPTMMTGRLASQAVDWTQAIIALLLQVLAMLAVARFGERIYARNVLSYSSEKIFRQLFRNLTGREKSVSPEKTSATEKAPENGKKPWFVQRRSGLGYNPNTWQGWLILIVAVVLIISIVAFIKKHR